MMNIFFRRGWYIVLCLVAVLIPVAYYNHAAPRVYQATTTIIYEESRLPVSTTQQFDFRGKESLLNQIQEIKSRSVALEVVSRLPQWVLKNIPLPETINQGFDHSAYYAAVIRNNVSAAPLAESAIIQIKVDMNDAFSAMTVANTICDVLSDRNLRIRREEVSGVRAFIEEQLQVYRKRLDEAESALRGFKVNNRVTSLDKEVEEMLRRATHVDIMYAEAKTAREKTERNLQAINEKITAQQKNLEPSIADVSTEVVKQLRLQMAKYYDQYVQLQLQGVPDNFPKMVEMRTEMDRIRENLAAEARQIAEAKNVIDPLSQISNLFDQRIKTELELETFREQERSLSSAMMQYERNLGQLPSKEYELARLMRERDLANSIYLMLSERREEARISEAEKVGNLRVIDRAELPKTPISPRTRLNFAIGIILGLTLGLGLAFFLESLDTTIKTPEEVERKVGLAVIGSIPRIRQSYLSTSNKEKTPLRGIPEPSLMLITHQMPNAPASEAFRTLRTNLQFSELSESLRTFMVTSSGPREGKSTIIANLAVTTAQMGLRTLVIGADLRRPTIHHLFGVHREPGLTNILLNFQQNALHNSNIISEMMVDEEDSTEAIPERMNIGNKIHLRQAAVRANKTIQQIAALDVAIAEAVHRTSIERLEVLPCGFLPSNPSEILASETMKDLLTLVKEKYEFVVIDAPPIIAVTDAAVLAPYVDAVALIVESGRNDREIIVKAKNLIDRVGVNLIGVILNNVREKNLYGDYDYYYTYYSTNFEENNGKSRANKLGKSGLR